MAQVLTGLLQEYAPLSQVRQEEECCATVVQALLEHGEVFVKPVQYRIMIPNNCHNNVLRLWNKGELAAMCVGYALAPDRKWRFHSWGLSKQQHDIVETTAPFLLYFGCVACI